MQDLEHYNYLNSVSVQANHYTNAEKVNCQLTTKTFRPKISIFQINEKYITNINAWNRIMQQSIETKNAFTSCSSPTPSIKHKQCRNVWKNNDSEEQKRRIFAYTPLTQTGRLVPEILPGLREENILKSEKAFAPPQMNCFSCHRPSPIWMTMARRAQKVLRHHTTP